MRHILNVFIFGILSLGLAGCSGKSKSLLPVHDEVLVYALPLDLTYLRTVEAVNAHPDWEVDYTDKEKGLIVLRNMRYSSFADADLRTAVLVLKRVGPRETSVQFDPESQAVRGGDEILDLIKQYLSREVGPV